MTSADIQFIGGNNIAIKIPKHKYEETVHFTKRFYGCHIWASGTGLMLFSTARIPYGWIVCSTIRSRMFGSRSTRRIRRRLPDI